MPINDLWLILGINGAKRQEEMEEDIIRKLKIQDKYRKLFSSWTDKGTTILEREEALLYELENLNKQINTGENLLIGSFDYRDWSLAFFTDNIFDVSGLPIEYFKKYGLEATMSMFHDEDREEMAEFHKHMMATYDNLSIGEKKTFGCTYTYRWVHRMTNEHIWQMSTLIPYITDHEGNIIFDLQIVVRLNAPPDPAAYNWEYHYTADNGALIKVQKQFNKGIHIKELRKRENQVVEQLILGKTSKEMAQLFGVSLHTILTHRRNIMKKLKLKNVPELIQFVKQY